MPLRDHVLASLKSFMAIGTSAPLLLWRCSYSTNKSLGMHLPANFRHVYAVKINIPERIQLNYKLADTLTLKSASLDSQVTDDPIMFSLLPLQN